MFSPALPTNCATQLLLSGQVAVRPDGTIADPEDPYGQVRQVFDNLGAVIRDAGGAGLVDLVRTTVYLVRADLVDVFYQVRAELYPAVFGQRPFPVSTLVIVTGLADPRFVVEIDGVAAIG